MDTKNLNASVTNINNIRFDDTWIGSAADNQIDSLNSFMDDFNKCVQDITAFNAILLLRDQYVKICDRIKELDALISGCSVDHDDPDSSCRCGEYANEIRLLEQQREDLRNTIIGLLGQFTGIDPEVDGMADLTTFDNVSPEELEALGAFNGEFPLYDQNDYANVEYYAPDKTIATSGCALTCAAMVISAYTGQTVTPDMLTQYYDTNLQTTMNHALAAYGIKSANNNALTEEKGQSVGIAKNDVYIDGGFTELNDADGVMNLNQIYPKLKEGYVFAAYMKPESDFTNGGHYVLITGVNEDGTLKINDPNGHNYNNPKLANGFENGFDPNYISSGCGGGYLIEPYDDYKDRQANQG